MFKPGDRVMRKGMSGEYCVEKEHNNGMVEIYTVIDQSTMLIRTRLVDASELTLLERAA